MEMEALTVRFRGNGYASSRCIGTQGSEGPNQSTVKHQLRVEISSVESEEDNRQSQN
jgi:hypothetical protein